MSRERVIRAVLCDVDGVLTDGSITYGAAGEETKTFHAHDGVAVRMLQEAGIVVGIISGRDSAALRCRCEELGIQQRFLGHVDKLTGWASFLAQTGVRDDEVAYIGDDITDLPLLRSSGFSCAPQDAHVDVAGIVHMVTRRRGGRGVLREVADRILAPTRALSEESVGYASSTHDKRSEDDAEYDDHGSRVVQRPVLAGPVRFHNDAPLVVMGGVNVLESLDIALQVGERFVKVSDNLGMSYVFKASFDKANRSSVRSFRGPGLERGLEMLSTIRSELGVPILTDVHEPWQAPLVAEVADILQIPAFLCRQTDLLASCARTQKPLHIKKMQMMAPHELGNTVNKCRAFGNDQIILCERGSAFGYGRLIVDPLAFPELKALGFPVTFDVTHALQLPGALGEATGGRGDVACALALAGVSQGLAGLFVEAHPDPDRALCDGPSATCLQQVDALLRRVKAIDDLIKSIGFRASSGASDQRDPGANSASS